MWARSRCRGGVLDLIYLGKGRLGGIMVVMETAAYLGVWLSSLDDLAGTGEGPWCFLSVVFGGVSKYIDESYGQCIMPPVSALSP